MNIHAPAMFHAVAWLSLGLSSLSGADTNCHTPPLFTAETVLVVDTNKSTEVALRYWQEAVDASTRRYYDQMGPPADFGWAVAYNHERYSLHEYTRSRGFILTRNILTDSARETALELLPVKEWRQSAENTGNLAIRFLAGLFGGSLGNTEEEDVPAVSGVPAFETLRQMEQFGQGDDGANAFTYGWKLLRAKPYVYAEKNFGHYDGRPIVMTRVRCYSIIGAADHPGLIMIEPSIVMPFSASSQVVVGASIYPTERSWNEHSSSASLRFECIQKKGVTYVGMTTDKNGQFYNVGYYVDF